MILLTLACWDPPNSAPSYLDSDTTGDSVAGCSDMDSHPISSVTVDLWRVDALGTAPTVELCCLSPDGLELDVLLDVDGDPGWVIFGVLGLGGYDLSDGEAGVMLHSGGVTWSLDDIQTGALELESASAGSLVAQASNGDGQLDVDLSWSVD